MVELNTSFWYSHFVQRWPPYEHWVAFDSWTKGLDSSPSPINGKWYLAWTGKMHLAYISYLEHIYIGVHMPGRLGTSDCTQLSNLRKCSKLEGTFDTVPCHLLPVIPYQIARWSPRFPQPSWPVHRDLGHRLWHQFCPWCKTWGISAATAALRLMSRTYPDLVFPCEQTAKTC